MCREAYIHVVILPNYAENCANICDKITDYHNGKPKFDTNHVIKWVSQFDNSDQKFILEELLHLLNNSNIYISEAKARKILLRLMEKLAEHFEFKKTTDFLKNVEFLNMQKKYKSQTTLLQILDEELITKYGIGIADCGTKSKKYAVYIDDILATGGTVYNDCKKWLEIKNDDGNNNVKKLVNKEKLFIVSLFCKHTWGAFNVKWRVKYEFNSDVVMDRIKFQANYIVENHPTELNQKYNNVYPILENQPDLVLKYFKNLKAEKKGEYAFRNSKKPQKESFFSNATNRIRFENILLNKGIELLEKRNFVEDNQRPLGMTNPTKKILGTGTLFFTWRNISNTTPIVFWWKVPGDSWYPLFDLDNRGIY